MTDQTAEDAPGDGLDALIASMTVEQFDALAQRIGHKSSQQQAADALSRLSRQQNLAGEDGTASTASAAAALKRHGRRR